MREKHLFGNFVPPNAKYMILGSFTAKIPSDNSYSWFYDTKRNQFWPILEKVYEIKLDTKTKKKELFTRLKIALADIISSCERSRNTSSDTNLINCSYNQSIKSIINKNPIEKIYFTSRFVENKFKNLFSKSAGKFNKENLIYLPSPSPRNARLTLEEKVRVYKEQLPHRV